jgi:hypothetical protein
VTRVVQTPSSWSGPSAVCTNGRCQWFAAGIAGTEDMARDHTEQTGHTVAVERTLRYTFQPEETP